jgi:hypothetical protein
MKYAQLLNSIGLVLGMVGVLVIFAFGPPMPDLEHGVGLALDEGTRLADGRTVAQHNADRLRLRTRHSRISQGGLLLVFAGFALQFWAIWT